MKRLWNAIGRLLPVLPAGTRRFLTIYVVVTSALAILDIAALGLLAGILTPLLTGAGTSLPILGQVGPAQYPWLLLVICLLMVAKAMLALLIQWWATRRLATLEMAVGDALFDAYIRAPWTDRLARSTAEIVRMADVGIANTIAGVVLPAISIPQLLVTFLAVLLVVLVAQPLTALISLIYLGLVAAFMYGVISRKAVEAGRVNLRYSLRVNALMTEMVAALKEITLRNQFDAVAQVVHRTRVKSTRARANNQFLGAVPQRVVEAALVCGFVLVGGVAYIRGGAPAASAAIALFGVAGFRMVPSIVSFQTVMTSTANALPHLEAVLRDINEAQAYRDRAEQVGQEALPLQPRTLTVDRGSFTYPKAEQPSLAEVTLEIPLGSSVGLVGASGAGKSTLVDVILGLLVPQQGHISVDGTDLTRVLKAWRHRVGYVPQDVALFDASIAQNIALTWDDSFDEERVRTVIHQAQLDAVVSARPEGIHAHIGERGLALSGGERQRLGIARALYTNPLMLVMDEATSALDTATEDAITQAISALHGQVTVISVAHRLSTIRYADQVCFLQGGRLVAQGRFEELVERVPEFAWQAHLAGLV